MCTIARRLRGGCLYAVGVVLALCQPSCEATFTGPYPCKEGFESCTTSDSCETSTASDGKNCGACGHACGQGSACVNGTCGAAPAVLASTSVASGGIAANGNAVVWENTQQKIQMVPPSGGTPSTLASCNNGTGSCSSGGFVIDTSNVYFSGNVGSNSGGPQPQAILKQPLTAGAQATVFASFGGTQTSPSQTSILWIGINATKLASRASQLAAEMTSSLGFEKR